MGIIKSGADTTQLEVDPTFKAAKIAYAQPEILGAYRAVYTTGTLPVSLAAASILYGFRNPSSNPCIINDVRIACRSPAQSVVASIVFSLYATRSYTVIETGNINAITNFKGNSLWSTKAQQMNARHIICATAGATGGTGTDDAQPLASVIGYYFSFIAPMNVQSFFRETLTSTVNYSNSGYTAGGSGFNHLQHPLVCAQNEGFRIRNDTVFPAGNNTTICYIQVEWLEVSAF